MSYLIDTCVIAELIKKKPEPKVLAWLASNSEFELKLSVLTLGELRKGIGKLPEGKRRNELENWFERDLINRFSGRLLEIDAETAVAWGDLNARLEKTGRSLPAVDALLAASALANGLTLVTRNEDDFNATGVKLFNPWK